MKEENKKICGATGFDPDHADKCPYYKAGADGRCANCVDHGEYDECTMLD